VLAGTEPKTAPGEYPHQMKLVRATVGAEYLVRSVPSGGKMWDAGRYLVVEVAVFPAPGTEILISESHFRLHINGSKQGIVAQPPGFVAAAAKYPEWERRSSLEVGGGLGQAGVVVGRPERVERFPGDPQATGRLPRAPKAPENDQIPNQEKADEAVSQAEAIVAAALEAGQVQTVISGVLYFAYAGKMKDLKTIELSYDGPAGKGRVKLQ